VASLSKEEKTVSIRPGKGRGETKRVLGGQSLSSAHGEEENSPSPLSGTGTGGGGELAPFRRVRREGNL